MKNRKPDENGNWDGIEVEGPGPMTMKKKKNMNRLGGRGTGLSLQAFANAKSTTNHYNPAFIKKKKEFYKNAKYVNKYKKSLKQQNQGNDLLSARRIPEDNNGEIPNKRLSERNKKKKKKKKKNSSHSLIELYEKQREEKEKARMEREAIIQAQKEQKEKSEAQRKEGRKKMFKKTRHGQPVMRYRIEHLLQSIQSSSSALGTKNV